MTDTIIREGNYLKPAKHRDLPLKLGVFGPSKSGKTYTSLKLMRGVLGEGVPFAVIDTENRGTEEYQGDPEIGEFDIAALHTNFAADRFVKLLTDIIGFGYTGIVVDGISPLWEGPGGIQAVADANNSGNKKFGGWDVANAEHQKIIRAIVECPVHLICTMRSKTAYIVGEDGKTRKVGLKPVQRDGVEYEFRLLGEMDADNNMKISGRRGFQNRVVQKPGAELAQELRHYLGSVQSHADEAHAQREAQDRAGEGATTQVDPTSGATTAPPPSTTTVPATPATGSAPAPAAAGDVLMTNPGGDVVTVPAVSVAALSAAGWTIKELSPPTPAAQSLGVAPGTAIPAPAAVPASVSTPTPPPDLDTPRSAPGADSPDSGQAAEVPPTNAPPTTIASGGAGQASGAESANPANAPGGVTPTPGVAATPSASPTSGQTEPSSQPTNGTTASGEKMEAGQLQKIVELCQELAVLKPDKGDANWWLEWANKKATEEYHQDFSAISRDNAAGLIERIEKTKLALRGATA